MKRFIGYGSIGQFRDVVRSIKERAQFVSYNEETKEATMDRNKKLPILHCTATEKIHGTNASVCYSEPDGLWVQSRKNIITVEKDNAGCAFGVEQHREEWLNIIAALSLDHNIDVTKYVISVYFEWCGGSIQKNSAVSSLDKRAIIFNHFKVSPIEPSEIDHSRWCNTNNRCNQDANIYNITQFKMWSFDINFDSPSLSTNTMIKTVENEIEPSSPLGESMGVIGNIGEGMVVTVWYMNKLYKFKVKGEKHSKSKVKKLAPVDEKFEAIKIDFVNNHACKAFRFEQAWQEVFGIENELLEPSMKQMGDFLRLVFKDIIKEELDVMTTLGIEPKAINGAVAKVARGWFIEELDRHVMGEA